MPIVPDKRSTDKSMVVCVNHASHQPLAERLFADNGGSSMFRMPDWHAVTSVIPPGKDPGSKPSFAPASGIPLKVFVCKICGYLEFYNAPNIDPETWAQK